MRKRSTKSGPRLVFADGTQSIYLADLSGDGLTDLVRIRNGEVCYWPNLGYGRFGAKVTMDNAPWFDAPDQFDQQAHPPRRHRRLRVDRHHLSGPRRRAPLLQPVRQQLERRRRRSTLSRASIISSSVTAVDLLGNGTACLVWSSPLPGDARRPMRYIDLMGGQKPHLLVKTVNNLGARNAGALRAVDQVLSGGQVAGKPWITKLPFPVHCRRESDGHRQVAADARFSTTYSYHHGYFDGVEREFRGFGRVEQVDVEVYGTLPRATPTARTSRTTRRSISRRSRPITWFHTGAALDRQRILTQFSTSTFRTRSQRCRVTRQCDSGFNEKQLPEPDLDR